MDLRDEFFHVPGDAEFWNESHYLDFLADGLQGYVRVGFYPNREEANLSMYLLDGEGVYFARDTSVPLECVHGLSLRHDDWEFALTPETVGREWHVEFGGRTTYAETAADVAAGDGTPADVDLSFTARGRHDPFRYSEGRDDTSGPGEDRYEQATEVTGTVTVDADSYGFEARGERDHSWGVREWTDGEWLWISGSFEDGAAYNHLSAWPPGGDPVVVNGFWFDGDDVHPLTDATLAATPPFGTDTAEKWLRTGEGPSIALDLKWGAGEASLSVEPAGTTPMEWVDRDGGTRTVINRSPARQHRDGSVEGRGFLENVTQFRRG